MEYDNTNSGALFKNDKQSDKQPDYKGPLDVEGEEYEVAAWLRKSKAGKNFMSIKIQKKDAYKKSAPKKQPVLEEEDFEDDIPF